MNIKRIFGITILCTLSLCATEITVDGSYSKLLGNPFKAKLETKTQDIAIIQGESKLIPLNVETNRNDFSFSNPSLEVLNTACNNVLKSFVSEDYNIVPSASRKISCEILPRTTVKLDYVMKDDKFMDQISDIVIHLVIRINDNGNLYEDTIDMNKDLNLKGASNYGLLSIRSVVNLDTKDLQENVHTILEYAIYNILTQTAS